MSVLSIVCQSSTLAPEIGAIGLNSTPDSGASFSCRCATSNVVDCLTLEVVHRHEKLVPEFGVDFWSRFLERVSGAYKVCVCVVLCTNNITMTINNIWCTAYIRP